MIQLSSLVALIGLLSVLLSSQAQASDEFSDLPTNCQSAREFITTHRYLNKRQDLGLSSEQSQKIAHKVSHGCTGSAKRFIYSLEILLRAEAAPRGAIQAAISLSQKNPSYTATFLGVFKKAYLKDHLDMDFASAFRLAEKLSTDYEGDVKMALEDFDKVSKYCVEEKDISLTSAQCGQLAGRVAKFGEYSDKPVAKAFIKAYEFIQSNKGPQVSINAALNMAENIVKVSPNAVTNFIQAYRYGINKKGMKMTKVQSLKFAQTMTNRTVFNPNTPFKIDYNRLPASLKKSKKD